MKTALLYTTVVDDEQLYFGLFIVENDSRVRLTFEKFQWDGDWSFPLANLDASSDTLPLEVKDKIWFKNKLRQGRCYVEHPLKQEGFSFNLFRSARTNAVFAEIIARPPNIDDKFNELLEIPRFLEEINQSQEIKELTVKAIAEFETRRGRRSKVVSFSPAGDILTEHIRRWTFPNSHVQTKKWKPPQTKLYRLDNSSPIGTIDYSIDYNSSPIDTAASNSNISDTSQDSSDDGSVHSQIYEAEESCSENIWENLRCSLDRCNTSVNYLMQRETFLLLISKFPRNDSCWNAVQKAGYVVANEDIEYDRKWKFVEFDNNQYGNILQLISAVDADEITAGQLILLNRLYQFIVLSVSNAALWGTDFKKNWNDRVYDPVIRHLRYIAKLDYMKTPYELHVNICKIFQDLYVDVRLQKHGCDKTDIDKLHKFLNEKCARDENNKCTPGQLSFISMLQKVINQQPAFALADCRWSRPSVDFLLKNDKDAKWDYLVYLLALIFPSITYAYGFDVENKPHLAFLLINFPLSVRYAILIYFDAQSCTFGTSSEKEFDDNVVQQMFEYTLISKLGLVFEESLDLIEYVRKNVNSLHLFSLNSTFLSAKHAFEENVDVLAKLQNLNPGFRTSFDEVINWSTLTAKDGTNKTYPVQIILPNTDSSQQCRWKSDYYILREYQMCVEVVRQTILNTYWGTLKIRDVLGHDVKLTLLWKAFFTSLSTMRQISDSKSTLTIHRPDMSTIPIDEGINWTRNDNIIERQHVYLAASLVKNISDPKVFDSHGHSRINRSIYLKYTNK